MEKSCGESKEYEYHHIEIKGIDPPQEMDGMYFRKKGPKLRLKCNAMNWKHGWVLSLKKYIKRCVILLKCSDKFVFIKLIKVIVCNSNFEEGIILF